MKNIYLLFILYFILSITQSRISAQINESKITSSHPDSNISLQPHLYVAHPNHREIILKSFELAVASGFIDTSGISIQEIKDRLEAGAYCEDFEAIPGIIGDHFPFPWNQGPDFNFYGLYPFSKIPYGSYIDLTSGWYRGLNHGYDPVQVFKWPGANSTTVEWANYSGNSYIWNNAVALYKSGEYAKGFQCLGHILHLLADLSIPSHVKIVDHGIGVNSINSGTLLDPDLLGLIVDEYEMALAGGIPIPGLIYIPDLYDEFHSALNSSSISEIPNFQNWKDYLIELGIYTYNHPIVNQFYSAPTQNGNWGSALNENGQIVNPIQYGITPPVPLDGRYAQVTFKSTANSGGAIFPETKMSELCFDLVPKAVEFGAGLLMYFYWKVTDVESNQIPPQEFILHQNYPNPFNPSTKISWQSPVGSWQTLKIYDVLGNEVATLVDEYKPAGSYEVEFSVGQDSSPDVASGVYFYQLLVLDLQSKDGKTENFIETKKMILIR